MEKLKQTLRYKNATEKNTENTEEIYLKTSKFRVLRVLFFRGVLSASGLRIEQ